MVSEQMFDPERLRDPEAAVRAYYLVVTAMLRSRSNQQLTGAMQAAWENLGRLNSAVFRSGVLEKA